MKVPKQNLIIIIFLNNSKRDKIHLKINFIKYEKEIAKFSNPNF